MPKVKSLKERLLELPADELKNLYKGFTSKKRCSQITGASNWFKDVAYDPGNASYHELLFLAKKLKVSPYSLMEDYDIRKNIHPNLQDYLKQTKDCKVYHD